MSDYNYSTGKFSGKDTLPEGNADKTIKGVDFEPEFVAISTAVNSKMNSQNPVIIGTINTGTIDGGTF